MTNLPRRRIEPLDPPPDSFDRVLSGARRRRRRHALVAASSTMVLVLVAAGSFALGSSLKMTQRIKDAANGTSDNSPTPDPVVQQSRTPSHKASAHSRTPAGGLHTGSGQPISWLRGRALDPNGQGIEGLYVLPGSPGHVTYSSDGGVGARTDAKGNYKIACPHAPVLLATWQLDTELQAVSTGGLWAATYVGSAKGSTDPVVPACGKTRVLTTLSLGASVHGTVHVQGQCVQGATFPLWVWLDGDRNETVRLGGLRDGDTFSFGGLPVGTHTLGAKGVRVPIEFAPGSSVEHDASFSCGDGTTSATPDESPTPTSTPTPTVSTSPPATPSPTPSPTVS